ncbi:hypothetical protein RJT34_32769 [Clitoria ternatea]|uniref:Uncharacterized protein n=1 Tax=Clitoria ternatea TaxID=43366 RepID=A0AAN9EZ37_CLITE
MLSKSDANRRDFISEVATIGGFLVNVGGDGDGLSSHENENLNDDKDFRIELEGLLESDTDHNALSWSFRVSNRESCACNYFRRDRCLNHIHYTMASIAGEKVLRLRRLTGLKGLFA